MVMVRNIVDLSTVSSIISRSGMDMVLFSESARAFSTSILMAVGFIPLHSSIFSYLSVSIVFSVVVLQYYRKKSGWQGKCGIVSGVVALNVLYEKELWLKILRE